MFDLLLNGLNLAGTASSIASYVNGFALERDVRQIKASLERLERINEELKSTRSLLPPDLVGNFLGDLSGLKSFGRSGNPAQLLANYEQNLRDGFRRQAISLVEDLIGEFRALSQAVRVVESEPLMFEGDLFNSVRLDPWAAGVRNIVEVPDGRIFKVASHQVITGDSSPLLWEDPWSQRRFMGTIPMAGLRRYGLRIEPPRYQRANDGFIYSTSHGLYLPVLLLERL